ncbi:MAG: response regulator [Armatimonadetes bacterium]|jgi:CheY-like chemotaxis protein|nr:response regulator [Armatimonadota bacterium]
MANGESDRNTILVVDDERDVVLATRIFLEAEGYNVLEAFDGLEALRVLKTVQPDLIMLDVRMPRLNGWKTLEAIQADEKLQNIPVLMLTSMNDPGHMATGINLGCTWYYTKPVTDYADLALVVRRILESVQLPPST